MLVGGLFSGIGGFELAFKEARFETSFLAEIDPAARTILRHRFPDTPLLGDVADIGEIPRDISVLSAGFPCQNLSMAGDKAGIGGEKSGVVEHMFRLVEQSRVPTVVIENVYFMLQLDRGSAMRNLVARFEALGYLWAYRVVDTFGFGLPQRRRRVYFVASRALDPAAILFADEAPRREVVPISLGLPLGFYWTEGRSGVGFTIDGIPPLKVGSAVGIPSAPAVLFPDGEVLMPSLAACERLQGFPDGWTRSDWGDEVRRRPEWRMLGNAVSVPVVSWLAGRIKQSGQVLDFERNPLPESHRWPDAAWNLGQGRMRVIASDKPLGKNAPSIETFRDSDWSRLSDRALNGFIKRAEAGGLKMPEGFLDALRDADRKHLIAA